MESISSSLKTLIIQNNVVPMVSAGIGPPVVERKNKLESLINALDEISNKVSKYNMPHLFKAMTSMTLQL